MNTDVNNYLFGSILSMAQSDVILSLVLSTMVILLFILSYNRIFAITFDENFAKATGTNTEGFNMIIAFLTALVIVVGMRLMGALLITSLIVFPALTAMRLAKRFFTVTLNSALISIICLWLGLILSYVYSTPTGASIVVCNIVAFVIYSIIQKVRETIIREK